MGRSSLDLAVNAYTEPTLLDAVKARSGSGTCCRNGSCAALQRTGLGGGQKPRQWNLLQRPLAVESLPSPPEESVGIVPFLGRIEIEAREPALLVCIFAHRTVEAFQKRR